jgi:arthrofactin-type cyclic lipopeptide synthetase C
MRQPLQGIRLPLSSAQQGIWLAQEVNGADANNSLAQLIRIKGPVDEREFQRAIQLLLTEIDTLRARILQEDGEAYQWIPSPDHYDPPFSVHDFSGEPDPIAAIRHWTALDLRRRTDLSKGSCRMALFRTATEEYAWYMRAHHIISDGYTGMLWARRGAELYTEMVQGRPLSQNPFGSLDRLIEADKTYRASAQFLRDREFWAREMAHAPTAVTLATRRKSGSFWFLREGIDIRADVKEGLERLGREAGSSLSHVMFAVVAVYLHRTTGIEDVVIGMPVTARIGRELRSVPGMVANAVPLRIRVNAQLTIADLVGRVGRSVRQALRHQRYLIDDLHRDLGILGSSTSLFRVTVDYSAFDYKLNFGDYPASVENLSNGTIRDMGIEFHDHLDGRNLRLELNFNEDLYFTQDAAVHKDRFYHLLEVVAASPEQKIKELEILSAEEREQILYGWNDTTHAIVAGTLVDLFEGQVERTPEAVAVVYEDSSLTYAELNRRANQLSYLLAGQGVGPESIVGLCLERSLEMVVGLLAILKAGGAYLPLDPAYPVERLEFMVEDAQPVCVVTAGKAGGILPSTTALLQLDREETLDRLAIQSERNPERASIGLLPEHPAYVIYTSGSTGTPKGVVIQHRSLANYLSWSNQNHYKDNGAGSPSVHSMGFDALVTTLFGPLLAGQQLRLLRSGTEIDALALGLGEELYTLVKVTPSHLKLINLEIRANGKASPTKALMIGGEALIPGEVAFWQQRFPDVRLINHYGPTEITVGCSSYEITQDVGGIDAISIGRPIWNTQVYVLDGQMEPVPVGVPGELYIAGAGLARGYLKRPDLTAERFIANAYGKSGSRMYRTGDLVRYLEDGNLEFLGRADDQVKIRGYRIELGEIETVLGNHPSVGQTVVVRREEENGEKWLVAYVVAASEACIDTSELHSYLRQSLPEYMVPAAYVRLESLPLTPNGKLDRKALPAPESDAYSVRGYEAPQGEIEQKLAGIWAEVLKLERVGRQDNFFSLGGHSLLAVRVVTRLRQAMNVEVAIRDLFAHPVLADLARELAGAAAVALPPIARAERSGHLGLSFAQQRLWFLAQLEGVSAAYHILGGLRLKGDLDHASLRRALDRIVARHETLRTSFAFVDEQPVQRIAAVEGSNFHLIEHDLRQHADAEAELRRLIAVEAAGSFDLEYGPLIRGLLLRLAEDEHALWITMHHIVSDGWSMGVLVHELSTLYGAFREGRQDPLPALEIQYADYAVWQRQWIEGEILQRQAEYWKSTLAGAPELLELPVDHPRPAQKDYAGASVELVLNEPLTASLRALSTRHGVTLYMTLLSAWAILMSRLSGQQDVVVGSPTANRGRAEIERLVGFFVNTLVLRLDLSGSPSVSQLLEQAKERSLAAQQHQDIPFEQVVELLNPVRSLSHSPIFQVMFAWQNNEQGTVELPGLELGPLPSSGHGVAKFDLTLSLQETGETISGGIEYAASLFEATTIERFIGYFRSLLEAMVADDTQAVDRLPMLSEQERDRVLFEWNDTGTAYPSEKCVHELFEEQAAKTPEAVAVVFEDEQLSYGDLNRKANRLAHSLRELGVRPDDRVALCVERGLEMIAALLGVLKAGGAYVPMDPAYPSGRLQFMLEDSKPVALLTQDHLAGLFAGHTEGLPVLDLTAAPWRDCAEENPDADSIGLTSNHLAYVIYTSGSTGQPKGVLVEHRGLCNMVIAQTQGFAIATDSRVLQFASFSFDACAWETMMALCRGAALYLVRQEHVLAGDALMEKVAHYAITHATLPPAVLAGMLEQGSLDSIRVLVVAGDTLSGSLTERWSHGHQLITAYGPTEATVCATLYECRVGESGTPPIGKPIANTRIYILDGRGKPVPVGVSGELYIGGAGVARGYLNRPELTAERFLSDPFTEVPGARMYRTGDLGRWLPDGNIEFLGRNDFQVKIRGFRIELGEIESRLMGHPSVREAVVLAREDNPGDKRLVAYYTEARTGEGEEAGAVSAEQLRTHLSASLPEYMVPAAYVRLESLPLTPNGKLDRKALPAPESDAYAARGYEAPQGEIEQKLAAIWAEVLKIERVGRHDNFFSLGGHSLLAVTLIERMRRCGFAVEVRALFITPTLAALAATVGAGAPDVEVPSNRIPSGCEAILPEMLPLIELRQEEIDRIVATAPGGAANVQDIYPLAPLQEGILFHHLMGGEGDAYLLSALAALDTREQLDAFLGAMQSVVDRHDILRTAVLWEGLGEPVQVVWRHARLQVEELEVDPLAGDIGEQMYRRFDPRQHRIDVRQAPLLRFYTAQDRENGRWLLMQQLHHLVGDHSTLEVMLAEVGAHMLGRQDKLPAPLPFRNLVAQARLGVSGEEHEAFFRQMLGDVDEPTAPFGLLDVRADGSGIEEAHLRLDIDLARRLRACARRLGVSVASLCHLAWARVLAKVSGREDVVFGTVLFGRMQGGEGSDRAMGLFINTLPVRLLTGDQGVETAVRQTHTLLADLMRHEHASLALAQRCSGVPAPAPLFSALLNYRHSSGEAAQTPSSEIRQVLEGMRILRGEGRNNYPFTLSVNDLGEGLSLDAKTPASIVPMRVCESMRVALESLTEALEASPARPVCTLDILPEQERHRLLFEWNDTGRSYPSDQCVHELFEEQVAKTPDTTAVVFEDEQLSYGELNRKANQLAHYLRELGVRPDDRVALCMERGFEMIVALLGVLKAGGAYVPMDPAYPSGRLQFMLEDSQPVALLTQEHLAGLFAGHTEGLPVLDLTAAPWRDCAEENPDADSIGLTANHLAYVIYTSGSTGQPKGVMVEHRNLANYLLWSQQSYYQEPGSGSLAIHSIGFDGLVTTLFGPLLSGQVLALPSKGDEIDSILRHDSGAPYTLLKLTPSHLKLLNQQIVSAKTTQAPTRTLMIGGEALISSDIVFWQQHFPGVRLINHFGPTEATVGCSTYEITEPLDETRSIPIGKPIANTRIYILDGRGEPVPVGVSGELYIGGAGVARGYLNRPELTAERFLSDPFTEEPGARLYRTGDLGRWLGDGNIEYLGRNDDQVKVRGFRIELGEIETRLMGHPSVREAVVLAREDNPGDKRLVAYYTEARSGEGEEAGAVSAEQLRTHLSASLPEYMVPAAYVRLESLPLTPNGKLDRKALPAPESDAYAARGYEAPQGEIEQKLAAIWAEVLKIERVGRHDNFFSLGGHSLLTIRVVAMIEQIGISILITDLFAHSSIESLAQYIGTKRGPESRIAAADQAIPIRETGAELPLFVVHSGTDGLLYIPALTSYIDVEIPVYGLPASEAPLQTVEGMAARMVKMIRVAQPTGPYRVAGWSFGGTLAYEIATQLIGEDQEVEFLGLLDTFYTPGLDDISQKAAMSYDEKEEILRFIESEIDTDDERRLEMNFLRSNLATMDIERLLQKLKDMSLIPEEYSGYSVAQMRYSVARVHATKLASRSYSTWQLPIPVHLFAAQESSRANPTKGWSVVVPKNQLRVISVPGTHVSMMRSPHIETVGRSLSQAIRDAAASSKLRA